MRFVVFFIAVLSLFSVSLFSVVPIAVAVQHEAAPSSPTADWSSSSSSPFSQYVWRESFENTLAPTWHVLESSPRCGVVHQQRTNSDLHQGLQSEFVAVSFAAKGAVFLGHTVEYPWVIEEMIPSVWVKSESPGIVIGVQIVFPKSIDIRTGHPYTILVSGGRYTQIKEWERIGFYDKQGRCTLLEQVERTVRMLRREVGVDFDTNQMYVRQVILFLEGNPQPDGSPSHKKIWIDDLEVAGHVPLWQEQMDTLEMTAVPPTAALNSIAVPFFTGPTRRPTYRFDPVNTGEFVSAATAVAVFPSIRVKSSSGDMVYHDPYLNHITRSSSGNGEQVVGPAWIPRTMNFPHFPNVQTASQLPNSTIMNSGYTPDSRVRPDSGYTPAPSGDSYQTSTTPTYRPYYGPMINGENGGGNGTMAGTTRGTGGTSRSANYKKPVIRMSSQQLNIDGSPLAMRAIQHHGEPLATLKQLGFNTVWFDEPVTNELLNEARQIGIWVVCPPPTADVLTAAGVRPDSIPRPDSDEPKDLIFPINDLHDNVLAWNVGARCVWAYCDDIQKWVELVRAADPMRRPVVCSPESGIREYSLIADVLMMRREPLLSTLELPNYGKWQRSMQLLAQAGTPFWATVQTQPEPKLVAQWELSGGGGPLPTVVSFEQIQMLIRYGIANGSHGFLFLSNGPLTKDDSETRYRATALELANLELILIDEWVAKGRVRSEILTTNRPEMSGILVESNRASLLMPVWNEPGAQFALGAGGSTNVEFRVPAPMTYQANLLLPGGTPPLNTHQRAGGRRIVLSEANMSTFVFLTQEQDISAILSKRARECGRRGAELAMELAAMQLEATTATLNSILYAQDTGALPILQMDQRPLLALPEQQTMLAGAKEEIGKSQLLFNSPDYTEAFVQGLRATQGLRVTQRNLWLEATRSDRNRGLFPSSVAFQTIPHYVQTYMRLTQATLGQNRLIAGDMENLTLWEQSGWRRTRHAMIGVVPRCAMTSAAAHSGRSGLVISAKPEKPEQMNVPIETAPVWVETHGIPVTAGELVCVNGWVNVPQKLDGSVDGLMVLDTVGGESLSLRFDGTEGWREFTYYRFIPSHGDFRVSFVMTGIGEAFVDDVRISPVVWNTAPSSPSATENQGSPSPSPSTPFWRAPLEQLNPMRLIPRQ